MLTSKQASLRQEDNIASYLGWHRVTGSGARPTFVGDVESSSWLGECKTHVRPYQKIHFDLKIWNKIADEATAVFKTPVYFVDDGSQLVSKTWAVFRPVTSFYIFDRTPYPFKVTNSLNFVHSQMRKFISLHSKSDVVMFFMWEGQEFWLTTLETFASIVGGM